MLATGHHLEKIISYCPAHNLRLDKPYLIGYIIEDMKKFNFALTALLLIAGLILTSRTTLAAVRCETQYGGGEVCVYTGELQLDKEVWNPELEKFVDNLGLTDYKFAPGEKIVFKLAVKNVGDKTFDQLNLKDLLPDYLELESGELEWEIADLAVDETEERRFGTRVVPVDKLPEGNTTLCVVNEAEVWSGDEKDKDTAQVCITKKVLGVTELPPTGPEDWLSTLFAILASGLAGVYLLKPRQSASKLL